MKTNHNRSDPVAVLKDKIQNLEETILSLLDDVASLSSDLHAAVTFLKKENVEVEGAENAITRISNRDLKVKLSCDRGLSRFIVARSGFSVFQQTPEDDKETSIIIACDGSLLSTNGRRTAAAGIVFKTNSPLNYSITVASKRSSTVPEICAIVEAIAFARSNKIQALTICSDSSAAIKFVAEALVLPVSGSGPLQKAVAMENLLAAKFEKVHGAHYLFTQLILVHQPSHQNVYDVFSELNASADLLAKSHAKQLAVNSLPVSASTPMVSLEIPRSPTEELEQLSSLMTRAAPMTLSPTADFHLENVPSASSSNK